MPKRKKGYRKFFKAPPKGCKPYKAQEPWRCTSHQYAHPQEAASSHIKDRNAEPPSNCHTERGSHLSDNDSDSDFLGWDEDPSSVRGVPRALNSVRVLSLFDGISCGLVALQNLGLDIEAYFSSEIDEDAISVQKFHFFNKVTRLGCVTSLAASKLESLGHIDLLLGGSPCNDLSVVNPRRRGLHGAGSSGRLFYDFVRIRNHLLLRGKEKGTSLFWLFENTTALEKQTLADMSSALECQPVRRCASDYVGMRRQRLFWGNVPLMEVPKVGNLARKPQLQSALKPYRFANVQCLPTVTTSTHSQRSGSLNALPVIEDGQETLLYISEVELLFGLPEHYTDVGNMSISRRRRLLGKAWCVPVIMDLLKPLIVIFKTT